MLLTTGREKLEEISKISGFLFGKSVKKKLTDKDKEKDKEIQAIINNVKLYQTGDPVDLYLKNNGIKQHNNDCYIYTTDKYSSLVNFKYHFYPAEKSSWNNEIYENTNAIEGIQQIFLTKEGQVRPENGNITSITRDNFSIYVDSPIYSPFVLPAKKDNSNLIYITTKSILFALKIQQETNNEVWYVDDVKYITKLPLENNKIYIFVFETKTDKTTQIENPETFLGVNRYQDKIQTLKRLNIKHNIAIDENNHKTVEYCYNEFSNALTIDTIKNHFKNKHILYIELNDLTDDIKQLTTQTPKAIEIEHILRQNKRTKTYQGWRPTKQPNTPDNDKLTQTFIGLQYDSMGLARRFLTRYGNQYKKVDGLGIVKQNKGIWEVNKQDELFNDIQKTVLATVYEWDYLTDPMLQESFKKLWIKKGVGEYKTISQVEEYVKRLYELNISIEEFDKETNNIINLKNGYFDLDKMELLEHNDSKLFLRQLNINYNPNAEFKNSDWEKFLLTTFCNKIDGDYRNDKEGMNKIHFLQKAIGYTFSTSIAEEKLFIIKGVTRSGKNTFLDTIQEVMGDYCGDMQDEEFITSKEQNSNYLLSIRASLKGKRFLHISEIGKNKKLNGSQIKRLTGNRRMTAKYMHQNSFSYKQQCKYWIATNNIDFTEFDESIKTKLMIIDFNKRFYEQNTNEAKATGRVIDKTLKDRLITDKNKEIILNWIIQGYWMYKQEGLEQTEEMKETLDEIERDNDSLGMFIKDRMETVEETATYKSDKKTAKEIYEYYRTYEKDNYSTPDDMIMGYRKFVKNIRARGYSVKKLWCRSEASMEIYITDLKSKGEFIINNNIGE